MKEDYKNRKGRNRPSIVRCLTFFSLIFIILSQPAFAQERVVTGIVSDAETGESIPGATVLIKGTSTGTITDLDGRFRIELDPNEEEVLIISFVGYQSQEIPLNGRFSVDIQLATDITSLDEVVVVGYGTQRKKVVTGATAQVKGDALEKRSTTSTMQALQGQAAGVSIRPSSGQPGEGFKVNIRGLGTIGNAGPLYIVDGIATGDINYLNNADIESVDILKDAASAAIYGSRAASGVVLITTKKGRAGQSQVTLDSYYGLQNRPKEINMLNASEYAQIMNEQHLNSGGTVGGLPFDVNNLPAYTGGENADTDWLDEMFVKNAVTENYTLGLTGGSEQTVYSVSFSYTGQEGIVGGADNSNFERYNARVNTEHKLYDNKLKIGENLTYSNINYSRFSDMFIQDGDFLRIGDFTLGYDFTEVLKVKNVSFIGATKKSRPV